VHLLKLIEYRAVTAAELAAAQASLVQKKA
jgi:hypothetical protein